MNLETISRIDLLLILSSCWYESILKGCFVQEIAESKSSTAIFVAGPLYTIAVAELVWSELDDSGEKDDMAAVGLVQDNTDDDGMLVVKGDTWMSAKREG